LAWTVTLTTGGPSKFGPKWIDIAPGPPGPDTCFGTLDDGCAFTAEQALASPAIVTQSLCKLTVLGGSKEVYQISTTGKPPVILVWETSGGSGGSSSSLEIRPVSDLPQACKASD
jgi:hypothetical protein